MINLWHMRWQCSIIHNICTGWNHVTVKINAPRDTIIAINQYEYCFTGHSNFHDQPQKYMYFLSTYHLGHTTRGHDRANNAISIQATVPFFLCVCVCGGGGGGGGGKARPGDFAFSKIWLDHGHSRNEFLMVRSSWRNFSFWIAETLPPAIKKQCQKSYFE